MNKYFSFSKKCLLLLAILLIHQELIAKDLPVQISSFIVDQNQGPFTTIQEAVTSAIKKGGVETIYVRPGIYRESLNFTGAKNLTLVGAVALGDEGQCEIVGEHTPPIAGTLILRNFRLSNATNVFSSNAKGESHLVIIDAYLNVENGYTFNLPNWTGIFELFDVNPGDKNDGGIYNIGGATTKIFSAGLGSGSAKTMILSGTSIFGAADLGCPVKILHSGNIISSASNYASTLAFHDQSEGTFCSDCFVTQAVPALIQNSENSITLSNVSISSTSEPVIAGKGSGSVELVSVSYPMKNEIAPSVRKGYAGYLETGISTPNNISFDRGKTTLSSDGELIIGDSTGVPKISTLMAGPGISIKNEPGSIRISAKDKLSNTVETVGEETVIAFEFPISIGHAAMIHVFVVGLDQKKSLACGGEVIALALNKDGISSMVDEQDQKLFRSKKLINANFNLVASEKKILLQVTGEKELNITWNVEATITGSP